MIGARRRDRLVLDHGAVRGVVTCPPRRPSTPRRPRPPGEASGVRVGVRHSPVLSPDPIPCRSLGGRCRVRLGGEGTGVHQGALLEPGPPTGRRRRRAPTRQGPRPQARGGAADAGHALETGAAVGDGARRGAAGGVLATPAQEDVGVPVPPPRRWVSGVGQGRHPVGSLRPLRGCISISPPSGLEVGKGSSTRLW